MAGVAAGLAALLLVAGAASSAPTGLGAASGALAELGRAAGAPLGPGQQAPPAPPVLLAPGEGAVLPQDNLWDECTIYGLGWQFAWRGEDAAAGYELHVEREGGPAPYVIQASAAPALRVGRCGCLPDDMLEGWRWRVRARAPGGAWSEWSAWRGFRVEPLAICMRGGVEH